MFTNTSAYSKAFFELVKNIGEAPGKQSQDRILSAQKILLKSQIKNGNMQQRELKEWVLRALYCEMLGHDASFAFIQAVKLGQSQENIVSKRTGYLFSSLCFERDCQYSLLLMNTITKDLSSSNWLNVVAGLIVSAYIDDPQLISSLASSIVLKLSDSRPAIRRRAFVTIQSMYMITSCALPDPQTVISKALADPDPIIMASILPFISALSEKADHGWIPAVLEALMRILEQVVLTRALPREYEYCRMPAPWIQARLLDCIVPLARKSSRSVLDEVQTLFRDIFTQLEMHNSNIAHGLIYELCRGICSLGLTDLSALPKQVATSFLASESEILLYCGIKLVKDIQKLDEEFAKIHAIKIMNSLTHPNEPIRRIALSLITDLTNPSNVVLVSSKLLDAMTTNYDRSFGKMLAESRVVVSELYSPSVSWFTQSTMLTLVVARDLAPKRISGTILSLVASGPSDGADADEDNEYRLFALQFFMKLFMARSHEWVVSDPPEYIRRLCNLVLCAVASLSRDKYISETASNELQELFGYMTDWWERDLETMDSQIVLNAIYTLHILHEASRGGIAERENSTIFVTSELLDISKGSDTCDVLVDTSGGDDGVSRGDTDGDGTNLDTGVLGGLGSHFIGAQGSVYGTLLIDLAEERRKTKDMMWTILSDVYRDTIQHSPTLELDFDMFERLSLKYAERTKCPEYRSESDTRPLQKWIDEKRNMPVAIISSGSYGSVDPLNRIITGSSRANSYKTDKDNSIGGDPQIPYTKAAGNKPISKTRPVVIEKEQEKEDKNLEREARMLFG